MCCQRTKKKKKTIGTDSPGKVGTKVIPKETTQKPAVKVVSTGSVFFCFLRLILDKLFKEKKLKESLKVDLKIFYINF